MFCMLCWELTENYMKIIDVLGITANQLHTKSKVQATLSVSLSKLRSQAL